MTNSRASFGIYPRTLVEWILLSQLDVYPSWESGFLSTFFSRNLRSVSRVLVPEFSAQSLQELPQ